MFLKGHRVITPFGTGAIVSSTDASCVVELSNKGRRQIGTFTKDKLKICSIVKIDAPQKEPSPRADKIVVAETDRVLITPPPSKRKKRGTQRQA